MPLIPLAVALLVLLALVLAMPLLLMLRYHVGTARRMARRGVTTLNLTMMVFSAGIFLWVAAITNLWVPQALKYSLVGLTAGSALGLLGLVLTRWEERPDALYYRPNRWLILVITLAVTARLSYGFWRAWRALSAAGLDRSWLGTSGVAGSLGVGAVVVGYYVAYSAGVCQRLRRNRGQNK